MEDLTPKERLALWARKFKYPLAVLVIGLGLMLLPTGESGTPAPEPTAETAPSDDLETTLEEILSQIQGAGQVRVLLTQSAGQEVLYQTDSQSASGDGTSSQNTTTVIVEDADRVESGLVRQTLEPVYRGAVIVCQGADDPSVRLAVVNAVRCVTGLGADDISVLKMK